MSEYSPMWEVIYKIYPPLLRVLEGLGFHSDRQPFVVGRLSSAHSPEDLRIHLTQMGFTPAILAWKDSDEILSVRKVDKHIFQWHIRLHTDGEIRGHYEYSSEGNPWGHVFENMLNPDKEFFVSLLGEYLA